MDSGSGSHTPPASEKSFGEFFVDPAALIGHTLARRYVIEGLLGIGSMGAVYAVRHLHTEGRLAAKILSPRHLSDANVYQRFRDEARIVAQLSHPHIVQVTDFDQDEDGTPFMVMEMLEGETLEARLQREGRLPLEQALALAAQVGEALHAAHAANVVHRDIKPDNIFLVRQRGPKDPEIAKVLDFGISKIVRSLRKRTQENTILGTPLFMSPEAATGSVEEIDGRADQFALAVILYQMLSGRLPFDGANDMAVLFQIIHAQPPPLEQLVPSLPPHVVLAIGRALGKDKSGRFPSILEFIDALRTPVTQVLPRPSPEPPPRDETDEIVTNATSELAVVETRALPLLSEGPTPLTGTDLPPRRASRWWALLPIVLLSLGVVLVGAWLGRARLPAPAPGLPAASPNISPAASPNIPPAAPPTLLPAAPPAIPSPVPAPPRGKPRPARSKPAPPQPRLQLDTAL